jgi:hypothetical protein
MSVGNVFAVAVVIAADEDWTFEDGHTYRLTAKRVGELGADAVGHWPVAVMGERSGTVALDLSIPALRNLIGSADWLPLQWGLDDLVYGPMGVDVAGGAALLGNQAYRPADTPPVNPDENTYTDAEVDALVNNSGPARCTVESPGEIGGGRVVDHQGNYYLSASATVPPLGITAGAAVTGADLTIQTEGIMIDSSWSWTPNAILYAGVNGVLTETAPSSGVSAPVAQAISATKIAIRIQRTITLA